MRRGTQPLRDFPLVVWLVAAVTVALIHRWVPEATWLLVHLIALGAMTHAVMVWSAHFTAALLKTRDDDATRRRATWRLALLGVGSLLVFVGVPTTMWWLVVAGATIVSVAVVWHAIQLVSDLRRALPGRFRICIRYYVAAACCLPVGAGFGVALAFGLDDTWHANLLVAHTMTNLLGWIGLTVVGTLVTFWPTVLRTRMDDRAEKLARQALPVLLGSLAVVVAGSLFALRPVAVIGIAGYALALVWWGRCLVAPLRKRPPKEFASASILAACVWAVVALVATAVHVLVSSDIEVASGYPVVASIWVAGFLVQLVTGALSYLLPSVVGGGPRVVRAGAAWFDRFATARLVVINGGLLLWLLPTPSWVRVSVSSLVLLAMASFLPLLVGGIRASVMEKRRAQAGEPAGPSERPGAFTGTGLMAGVAALVLAVSIGVGVDPGAVGLATSTSSSGEAVITGNTVRVQVVADGMVFTPHRVEVDQGDRLVIDLVNEDTTTVHDLSIGDQRTSRLKTGEHAELDLGPVQSSIQGWCTVVGHRQMGMVFDVVVRGSQEPAGEPSAEPTAPMTHHHGEVPEPEPITGVVDPVLAPATNERVHKVELRATDEVLEVAPGVWQQRWTYNGQSVGPTLRGRVGDVFEVTLVNDGTIGHSVDFHAGTLAPDVPMRTIAPGESLVYTFTAERAGIWMYHCSTMPMSAHIAAGMHGAVIIDPEGLPEVDREYVLVQSEVYLGEGGASPEDATEVDADAVTAEQPDKVVFNGVANQYDQKMFQAKVGERVRFWVLDAGPNRPSAFHIVGGQFDTVYFEGGYQLKDGVDAFGTTGGGSQVLGLHVAQGGFVELEFPEAGHYPVVSHVMVDAERGAHGVVEVTD
ncbi:multicopper oxidase domain-containing protein [Tessaracoccus antarcticus]|uniref:multicopper oxidase domain-containing protein n=1 Tax=Tessaracoccus antarcticus TaxID=2479848 RepID=UPI001F39A48E|nr:multicopper oxidase domain-containing protein [Tessaracoccus antarcticus]